MEGSYPQVWISTFLVGGFKQFCYFYPWGNDPTWRVYLSNGLVQPPTIYFRRRLYSPKLESWPSQKEVHLPTPVFQVRAVSFRVSVSMWNLRGKKSHQLPPGWWMQLPVTLSGYMALWNPWPKLILLLGNLAQLVGWQGFSIETPTQKWRKQMKTEMWCRNVALILCWCLTWVQKRLIRLGVFHQPYVHMLTLFAY